MLIKRREKRFQHLSHDHAGARTTVFPLKRHFRFKNRHKTRRLRLLRINRKTLYVLVYRLRRGQCVAVNAKNRAPLGEDGALLLILPKSLGETEETVGDELLRARPVRNLISNGARAHRFSTQINLHARHDGARRERFWK